MVVPQNSAAIYNSLAELQKEAKKYRRGYEEAMKVSLLETTNLICIRYRDHIILKTCIIIIIFIVLALNLMLNAHAYKQGVTPWYKQISIFFLIHVEIEYNKI